MKLIKLLMLLFTVALSNVSFSFEPFFSDDTGTVEHNKNQIDVYYFNIFNKPEPTAGNYAKLDLPDVPGEEYYSLDRSHAFPFTYIRGVSEHTEASVGVTYYGLPTGNYNPVANLWVGFKNRFYGEAEEGWSFAVRPGIFMPVTTSQQEAGLGLAKVGAEIALISSYFSENYDVHFNLAARHVPYDHSYSVGGTTDELRETGYFASTAFVYKIHPKWKIGVDFGLESNPVLAEQGYNYFILGGLMYTPIENVTIGLSYLRVSTSFGEAFVDGPYSSIAKVGLTYRF